MVADGPRKAGKIEIAEDRRQKKLIDVAHKLNDYYSEATAKHDQHGVDHTGDVSSDAWIPLIATLDVIIETVTGSADGSRSVLERVEKAATALRPPGSPLLSYIYTSGTWVHGDSRTTTVTDTTPILTPAKLVAWRPAIEQLIVSSTVLNGIVIRPALLYGRSASIFSMLFKGAAEGRVSWPGTPGGRYALVHADDLAELYVLCAEKASVVGGKIVDGANPMTESVDELLEKLVRVSGARGPYEYREPADPFEEAITTNTLLRPYLANALLGWTPKKQGFVDGLEMYYVAWQASL